MPVSGLVLTLSSADGDDHAVRATLDALAADARVTVGPRADAKLPIALDTPGRAEDRAAWRWIEDLPAVRWIDLVWVGLDPGEPDEGDAPGARHV